MSFLPAELSTNAIGWGPTSPPEELFNSIPFATFSKEVNVIRLADYFSQNRSHRTRDGKEISTTFNEFADERAEDSSFSVVDSNPTHQRRHPYSQRGRQQGFIKQQRAVGGRNWQAKERVQQKSKKRKHKRVQWTNWSARNRKFEASIEIDPAWGEPLKVIDFASLTNVSEPMPELKTIESAGTVEQYNDFYDRLAARQEKPLERNWAVDRKFIHCTTSDDPVLNRLRQKQVGNVYIIDSILAVLMTAVRSKYSWDIVVTKKGKDIMFDKRDNSFLDLLTVNENSSDPPTEDATIAANALSSLHKEAAFINYNFSQQVLFQSSKLNLESKNPFQQDDDALASVGYFYKTMKIDDENTMVIRTEVDGYEQSNDKKRFVLAKALNEFDLKVTGGWRQKLETQRAGTFATEVKNNNTKLARWGVQAVLANAFELKLGYVTRTSLRDPYSHVVLGVERHRTSNFLDNIGCDINNFWAVFKAVLAHVRSLEGDGRFLILRSPNEKQLLIYNIGNSQI